MEELSKAPTAKELLANPNAQKSSVIKLIGMVILSLLIDTGLPLICYFILRHFMDPVVAMLISGLPALAICILRAILKRELSVTALMIFIAFVGSAVVALLTDDARILLLEKSLTTGVIGLLHLATLIPLRIYTVHFDTKKGYKYFITVKKGGILKPLPMYSMNQMIPLGDMNPLYTNGEIINKYVWLWENIPIFRIHVRVSTFFTGFLLSLDLVVKLCMIFSSMSIDDVMLYSSIGFYIFFATLLLFNGCYIFFAKRGFDKHLDKWIAQNYARKQIQEEKLTSGYQEQPPVASFMLFSDASSGEKYDPLLQV